MGATLKTRFCPSPTGLIHLGNARTALLSYLRAHASDGAFLLRIEDTDQERSKVAYTNALMEDLKWLGLNWDEGPTCDGDNGPYYQSERQAIYDRYYDYLIEKGLAYPCFCSEESLQRARKRQLASGRPPRYAGTCRDLNANEQQQKRDEGISPTLRFAIDPNAVIEFDDLVYGPQRFLGSDLGDFIIRRSNGTPPFMYCNAIDDALMGVNCVLRGEDHLTNTPRQILILNALDLPLPDYGHMAMILGSDGAPLSKRNGSRSIAACKEDGFLPEALVNYMARLGHYYENGNELLSMQALAKDFSVSNLGRSAARFDESQLIYWQRQALAALDQERLWAWMGEAVHAIVPTGVRDDFVQTIRHNITFPSDACHWAERLFADVSTAASLAQWVNADVLSVLEQTPVSFFKTVAECVQEGMHYSAWLNEVKQHTGCKGKALFQPLRVAMTGETHGPELASIYLLLGTKRVQERFVAFAQLHEGQS